MGYREFTKDYKIEYVDCPGRKRPKAVRVYVGPWYRFVAPPEKIRFLRWFYLVGLAAMALLLLIPMCINCTYTRIWYIQVPAAVVWIPWMFAVCAAWRLWTAGDQVNREHNALMGSRMSGACVFMMFFCFFSFVGCFYAMSEQKAATADYIICMCYLLASACAIALFSHRKGLDTVLVNHTT